MEAVKVDGRYRHFVTGEFNSHAGFLPDEIYTKVLDNIVITCVDIVVVHQGKILLGKRAIEPNKDWWVVGGRMKPGESFEDAAARNIKRELNLEAQPSSFQYLNTQSLVWPSRAQAPKEHGCHDVVITMVLRITAEEKKNIKPNNEYEEIRWISPSEILTGCFKPHPALVQHAKDL